MLSGTGIGSFASVRFRRFGLCRFCGMAAAAMYLLGLLQAVSWASGGLPPTDEYPPRPALSSGSTPGVPQIFTPGSQQAPPYLLHPFTGKDQSKVKGALRDFIKHVRDEVALHNGSLDGRTLSTERFLVSRNLAVQVYIRCNRWNDAIRSSLEQLGLVTELTTQAPGPVVQGWLPYDAVDRAAQLDFVNSIEAPAYPVVNMGSKTAESDAIHRAATARLMYSIDGTGTRVGVISDSADLRSQAQATGDLPPDSSIYVGKAGTGANEGTAMMEIVYDEAPGALLGFYGPSTSLDMSAGIADLAAHGCSIISDDLTYLDQPCFQEGPIEQTINTVTAGGTIYFTSAANFARLHYTAPFSSISANVLGATGLDLHNFGALVSGVSSYLVPINCPANTTTYVVLQWDSPWGYAADDYDLYLCDSGATGYFAKSDDTQSGLQNPEEIIAFNPGTTGGWTFGLIHHASGAARKLKIYVMRGTLETHYQMPIGSIGFNNKAQNALVVGAISAENFGGGLIETFSCQGPVAISYPAPATWNKPDITGIDGVQVTGAGGFPVPFYGTSAASPAVAGVAALVKSAKLTATVDQVKAAITQHASDRGTTGYDTVYGWGLADALPAVQAVLPANHLLFYASPGNGTAGAPFTTQPMVAVLNQSNAVVTSFTGTVSLFIKSGTGTAGAVLNGTVSVNAVAGVATFSGLSLNLAGSGYVLTASAVDTIPADSLPFNIAAAPVPAKLAFVQQPGGAASGANLSPQPSVAAQDATSLTVTSFTGPITLAIKSGTGASGAVLKGTVTVNAVNGIATFSGLSIDKGGTGYVLTASSGTIPTTDSNPFTITASYPPGDVDKNGVFNIADLVLGCRVLGGLGMFP